MWIEMSRIITSMLRNVSRPARALWIEIIVDCNYLCYQNRRGPRGPCGLKFTVPAEYLVSVLSRPARALWIEIRINITSIFGERRRGPRGPCGLKYMLSVMGTMDGVGRGPRGPCGLKSYQRINFALYYRRGPRGPCGLKSSPSYRKSVIKGRGPRGPCGLKSVQIVKV